MAANHAVQELRRNDYDHRLKILMLGDTMVGKSSLLLRFCEGFYHDSMVLTIGVDFKLKDLVLPAGLRLRLQVWDTAGQERFRTITPGFYRSAMGVVIVYDITSQQSFDGVRYWMSSLREHASEDVRKILVGNKSDLEGSRQVSREAGQRLADQHGVAFFEASALEGQNVEESFVHLCKEIVNTRFADRPTGVQLGASNSVSSTCKC
mmetsp:Transcript_47039/g.102309  ORF Transcript_47039/g.102309 Transcript_47039/m.102309 type:complete len:207 (+) Transcript_47039:79-699(+)